MNEAPRYFSINAQINKEGYESIDCVKTNGLQQLAIATFKEKQKSGSIVLDTRNALVFTEGFVPGSIF